MNRLRSWFDTLRRASAAEPIQCPRGWGEVSFQVSFGGWTPFFTIEHTCPIGGVDHCAACNYPVKPEEAERLRENLEQLDSLRKEGVLTESEYTARRRMVAGLVQQITGSPGEGFRITAWILGPTGLMLTTAGVWLAQAIDPVFWTMTGVGAVMLTLCVSFTVIAITKGQPHDDKAPHRDPSLRL